MILRTSISALALGLVPLACGALTLDFPAAGTVTAQSAPEIGHAMLPVAPYRDGDVRMRAIEGQVQSTAWRIASRGLTTFQLLAPLRAQLEDAGFEVRFACADRACGGFDFRYATDLLPEPAMHVDLGDFRYLLAERGEGEAVALMVSRAPNAGFVQVTQVAPRDAAAPRVVTSTKSIPGAELSGPPPPAGVGEAAGDIVAVLRREGAAPLDDLLFQTGSASLSDESYGSLGDLAAFLRDAPEVAVTLVGHTDDEGALAGNIALSKRRAQSVRDRLIRAHGVAADRLRAEGVGFLAPRASNASPEGRLANRRVEAILTP